MVTARPLDYELPIQRLPVQPSEFKKRLINLIAIMETIGGSNISSITGLFVQLFADEEEVHQYQLAIMLEKALYWISRLKKTDYEFFRTDAQWMGDIGLTRYKLRKLREKLEPIVTCQNKHNWSRTKIMHYKLNGDVLVERIAQVYGKTETFIRGVLFDRAIKNPDFQQSRPNTSKPDFQQVGANTSKSLTSLLNNSFSKEKENNTTTHAAAVDNEMSLGDKKLVNFPEQAQATDDSEQVDLLVNIGVWRKEARKYSWIPIDTLQSMIDQAQQKQHSGQLRGNLPNYLAGTLKKYAEALREEYKHALQNNPELTFEAFIIQHEQQTPSQKTNPYQGLSWSDFTSEYQEPKG